MRAFSRIEDGPLDIDPTKENGRGTRVRYVREASGWLFLSFVYLGQASGEQVEVVEADRVRL